MTFDTGNVLMHKRFKPELGRTTTTGRGLCPEHRKLSDDGYVALVECDDAKSTVTEGYVDSGSVWRTGNIMHIRRSAAAELFNREVTAKDTMWFIDEGLFNQLKGMIPVEAAE